MKSSELKQQLLIEQDGPYCYECVFPKATLDLHHGIIHNQKRFYNELTTEINCVLVCRDCHPYCNSHEWRVKFLHSQHEKYKRDGANTVYNWFINLPEKLQRTNEWILNELMSIETEELK